MQVWLVHHSLEILGEASCWRAHMTARFIRSRSSAGYTTTIAEPHERPKAAVRA
jgi:hypothetical protein